MKLAQKMEAVRLRRLGLTYSVIRKKLGVSKSSLSLWLRDVELTPEQQQKILVGLEKSRFIGGKMKRAQRQERTEAVINLAHKEFAKLSNNPLFFIGLSLYMAEGDKHAQERVKFANADPHLIKLIMKWFREICCVPEHKFRIALHIHDMHSNEEVINFWENTTGVPKTQFHQLYIKPSSLRQRRNILYNGTCSVIVNSRDLFRKIHAWKAMLLEQFEA